MHSDITIELAGEELRLLPERAIFWPRWRALLVADTHWGKATAFRAAGLAIPPGSTSADLARLDQAIDRCGAGHLMLLGDALHARSGRGGVAFEQIGAWRARRPELAITLIRGNHDRGAGDPPPEWGFDCVDAPHLAAPFALCHTPAESAAGYVLAGHLHPVARLQGAGRQRLRLPCFWFGARVGVLPAFGSFTGGAPIAPAPTDRVFALADGSIVALRSSSE